MPFAIAAAGIGLTSTVVGGIMQKNAQDSAQEAAQRQIEQGRSDLQPYRDAGLPAVQQQNALLGLSGPEAADDAFKTFRTSPGYEFVRDQGIEALDQSASRYGLLRSGALTTAVQKFGADLASLDFDKYYNRLMGMSKLGLDAAGGAADVSRAGAGLDQQAGAQDASVIGNTASGIGGIANQLLSDKGFQSTVRGLGTTSPTPVVGNPYTPSIYGQPSPY